MKTNRKDYQQCGNRVMVQFGTLDGDGLDFIPAAMAMETGELRVREVTEEGSVNRLLAVNGSNRSCLITDMDLLKGARQNRVVNSSVLVAPHSKQVIDVSCVERMRWTYNSPQFTPSDRVMDLRMRTEKASSLMDQDPVMVSETQSRIWDLINREMMAGEVFSFTEDYNEFLESKMEERAQKFRFIPGSECNGLAVFEGRRLLFFDIFGNRAVYGYYFDKIAEMALGLKGSAGEGAAVGQAKAFYRLDEFLDSFESGLGPIVVRENGGVGDFRWSALPENPGFSLTAGGEVVHMAGFVRVNAG